MLINQFKLDRHFNLRGDGDLSEMGRREPPTQNRLAGGAVKPAAVKVRFRLVGGACIEVGRIKKICCVSTK